MLVCGMLPDQACRMLFPRGPNHGRSLPTTGLSYTSFVLSKFSASPNRTTVDGSFTLSLVATNTGSTDGAVPIQVYFRDPVCYPVRIASIQLVRFSKVFLKAQESKTVTFELDAKDLRYWDDGRNGNPAVGAEGGWVVPTPPNACLHLATHLTVSFDKETH